MLSTHQFKDFVLLAPSRPSCIPGQPSFNCRRKTGGRPEIVDTTHGNQLTSQPSTQVFQESGLRNNYGQEGVGDNIFEEGVRRTVKYQEAYLRTCICEREGQRELVSCSGSTMSLGP